MLRDVREVFLHVAEAGAHDNHASRSLRADLADDAHLTSDIDERIMRRLVAIAGRIGRGTLEVRVIVRRAGGGVEDLDA